MSRFPPEPPGGLLRFLAIHLAIGSAVGLLFSLAIVAGYVGQVAPLLRDASEPLLAILMLCIMNMLTFGSLAMGVGVMTLPRDRDR
jgi:hypothetical protein